MQDAQVLKKHMEAQASYLGKKGADIFKSLDTPNPDEIVKELKAHAKKLGVTWYGGNANLNAFVAGSEWGFVNFGDYGSYNYSGDMWSSPIFVFGGGGGPWSRVPRDGEVMEFIWWGASALGGSINILFKADGVVIGTMVIVVGGAGLGGGKGSVTWTKGS